ncbi:MAG: hypothetical protein WB778_05500 [Thermoplasmata archaeon]
MAKDAPGGSPSAAPEEAVQWTEREQPRYLTILMVMGVWALAVVELALIEIYLVDRMDQQLPLAVLVFAPIFVLVGAVVIWRSYRSEPKRIGVSANGFHMDWGSGPTNVPWEFVTPAFLHSRWASYPIFYRVPGSRFLNHVFLTPMQARSLLLNPDRPPWPLDEKVSRRLQISA